MPMRRTQAPSGHSERLEYALDFMLRMLSQHHAMGLQTDCIMTVMAPIVGAADSHVHALWPETTRSLPCVIYSERG